MSLDDLKECVKIPTSETANDFQHISNIGNNEYFLLLNHELYYMKNYSFVKVKSINKLQGAAYFDIVMLLLMMIIFIYMKLKQSNVNVLRYIKITYKIVCPTVNFLI